MADQQFHTEAIYQAATQIVETYGKWFNIMEKNFGVCNEDSDAAYQKLATARAAYKNALKAAEADLGDGVDDAEHAAIDRSDELRAHFNYGPRKQ